MSDKPLGRDRLGRLVYEGDWFVIDGRGGIQNLGALRWGCGNRDFKALLGEQEVDLAESPKRSNYERYFADLGTLKEICRIVNEICSEEAAIDHYQCSHWCLFEAWSKPWASMFNAPKLCRTAFKSWLQQEATE